MGSVAVFGPAADRRKETEAGGGTSGGTHRAAPGPWPFGQRHGCAVRAAGDDGADNVSGGVSAIDAADRRRSCFDGAVSEGTKMFLAQIRRCISRGGPTRQLLLINNGQE